MTQKILINYANEAFKESQKKNSETGMKVGNFDRVIEYSEKDINKNFYEKNKHILNQARGGGYWLWKPYIILKTLMRKDVKDGDFIFYADSGSHFIEKVDYLIKLSRKYKQDIVPFTDKNADIEKTRTKIDTFLLMNLNSKKYTDTPQRGPGFILIKKSKLSIRFVKEFLKYAQDERIITDMPSQLGEDHGGFIETRNDQSIFSLLTKKYKLKAFRHPFKDESEKSGDMEDKYPQIVILTRKNNRSLLQKIAYQNSFKNNNIEFVKNIIKMFRKKFLSKI